MSQLLSIPSLPNQRMKACSTPSGSRPPNLYEQQCEFFYVPQESEQWKSCETGPTVFHPYHRRLECLTICRCHNKGSTFSSVISRPWVFVRPGFEHATSRSADWCLSSSLSNKCTFQNASTISNVTNNKSELRKTVRLTIFKNPQFQSVLIFFKFVHPCLRLYLLCY